jgi:hypothetical protein
LAKKKAVTTGYLLGCRFPIEQKCKKVLTGFNRV